MTVTINFRLEAVEEIDATFQWYEEQRGGLGEEFFSAFLSQLDRFGRIPRDGPFFIARFVPAPCDDFLTSFTIASYRTRSTLLPFNTGTGIRAPGGEEYSCWRTPGTRRRLRNPRLGLAVSP
jgi:hypothetical protein